MYTILLNESNELITSVKERIMQRSKLVDSLHFLIDPIYKGIDMSDFVVTMEYILPISREYKTEILVKSDELYKEKLEYKLPFNTCLTKEHGKIEVQLTFTKIEMDLDGNSTQYVRKTSPTTITIVPISAWSDIIPDEALSAIDQRIIKTQAQISELEYYAEILNDNKVDNLVYDGDKDTLYLSSNGKIIGDEVPVKDMLDDGVPVIDLSSTTGGQPSKDNCNCGCDCDDDIVDIDEGALPGTTPKEDEDIVEF